MISTHEASGERIAPLGSTNPVEESKATPVPSCPLHAPTRVASFMFRRPDHPPVGSITISSPSAVISRRRSRLRADSSRSCSGLNSRTGRNRTATPEGTPRMVASFSRVSGFMPSTSMYARRRNLPRRGDRARDGYILSGASTPNKPSPAPSTYFVAAHSASRRARTLSSSTSTWWTV